MVVQKRRHGRKVVTVDQHVKFPEKFVSDALKQELDQAQGGLPFGFKRLGGNFVECSICQVTLTSDKVVAAHGNGKPHLIRCLFYGLQKQRKYLIADKEDIVVTTDYDVDNGYIKFDIDPEKKKCISIQIENKSGTSVYLMKCVLLKNTRNFRICPYATINGILEVKPSDPAEIKVNVHARYIGRNNCPIAFMFTDDVKNGRRIHIVRYISACCTNDFIKQLQPKAPYRAPPKAARREIALEVIEGLKPPGASEGGLERDVELKDYRIPAHVTSLMNRGLNADDPEGLNEATCKKHKLFRDTIYEPLTMSNYKSRFSALLHVEEHQMQVDIRKYDMEAVTIERYRANSRLLTLQVPGLAENRPSLLKGDKLFVSLYVDKDKAEGGKAQPEYVGYVHEVHECQVVLGFGEKLLELLLPNMKFNVRFTFSRHPLRMQHRAVELAEEHSLDAILFPVAATCCTKGTIAEFSTARLFLYDKKLEDNAQQFRAVRHILAGTSRPAPYVVFGPPGTGKTVTLVEAMKQICKNIKSAHVLACAPSNSAADLITERLIKHIPKSQVFRMHAVSRNYKSIPAEIRECGNIDSEGNVHYPKRADLAKYRVVVCTLTTAGRIASANFPPGHFSHVFIDESGHAVEPEAVIALAGIIESDIMDKTGGQVVLAGDPKQLGPILRSPVAKQFGLGLSMLERYMSAVDVYKRIETDDGSEHYDPRLITKLVMNYRSHPKILELPNRYFYHSELVCSADQGAREALCKWSKLPKKGFPLLFHGVYGEDMREEKSPSYFNPQEVKLVKDYVKELLGDRSIMKLQQSDIGVITPYRKQVQKIQSVLTGNVQTKDIKVGSVEEFQGQERKVIIISTVRSDPNKMEYDSRHSLGFLRNPKRFNVAITRAKALLVVIGNPCILASDPCWKALLDFIVDHGGYKGEDYERTNDADMDHLIQTFEELHLTLDFLLRGADTSDVQHYDEPAWGGSETLGASHVVGTQPGRKNKK